MSFVDRLSGQSLERPPQQTHFGRWLFDPDDRPGHVNGHPAGDGDALVPGATGDWEIVRPGDTIPVRGRFFADALPDDQDAEALLQLGQVLRGSDKAEGGWLEWNETSPLAPGLDEAVEPHPLEDRIETEFEHLAAVCRKPRTHIRREAERVLVHRARRIARGAPERLASHTEDWEHRTIAGIRPRRILADIREERWDLYENRVAVRLVDDLVAWLRRRIAGVRRIRDDVYARMEKIRGSASGTRYRADRIYKLWGEGWDDSPGEVAESTLKRLENLLYKLLGLMDSPLYKHIPVRASAPGELRSTNLFSNDDHYRGVARLWHEWSRLAVPRPLSPSELYARYQNLHRGFNAWCMLVIVRACSQLRLDPVKDEDLESEIRPGNAIRLDQSFRIEWDPAGAITFADEGRALLRFVPLIHGLEGARTREAVEARIAPLVEAVAGVAHWTVILHPAVPGKPPHDTLAGAGNPPVPGTLGAIDFIRVSPFSLDSVERVSRAIRWATLVPRMLAYPPAVQAIPESALQEVPELQAALELDKTNGAWLVDRGRPGGWAVVRPPPDGLLQDVARYLKDVRARRDRLEQEREQLRGDHRNNSKRAELNRQIQKADDLAERLDRFVRESCEARRALAALAKCPSCGESDRQFKAREQDCFAARCRSTGCGAQWELRHDPEIANRASGADRATDNRIPVFQPGGADPDDWPVNTAPQWVDDFLGCDVLAIPEKWADGRVDPFLPLRTTPRSP